MWSRDFLRVLHGAGKVAEQLSKAQVPDLTTQSSRLAKHVGELARVAPHLFGSVGDPTSTTPDLHQQQHQQHQQQQEYESAAAPVAPAASVVEAVAPASQPASTFVQESAIERELKASTSAATSHKVAGIASSLSPRAAFEVPAAAQAETTPVEATIAAATSTGPVKAEPLVTEPVYQTVQDVLNGKVKEPQPAFTPDDLPLRDWKEKHVPSSPLSRILGFGGLAAKLAVGTATEIVRSGGKGSTYSALISDSNVEKLAETLCTMRGAALKLGQMLSIQDENMVPPKLAAALDRVRQKYVCRAWEHLQNRTLARWSH